MAFWLFIVCGLLVAAIVVLMSYAELGHAQDQSERDILRVYAGCLTLVLVLIIGTLVVIGLSVQTYRGLH